MDREWTYRNGKRKGCISQHRTSVHTTKKVFNHSGSTETNKIATVRGSLPYPPTGRANWLTDLLHSNYRNVRHPLQLSSLYIFSFTAAG